MPRIIQSDNAKDIGKISDCINDILTHQHSGLSYGSLCTIMNKLVNKKEKKLQEILKENISKHFEGWCKELEGLSGKPLITRFALDCIDFGMYCRIIPKVYEHYDNWKEEAKLENEKSENIIRDLFYKIVLDEEERSKTVIEILTDEINQWRTNPEYNLEDKKHIKLFINLFFDFKDMKRNNYMDLCNELKRKTEIFYTEMFNNNYPVMKFPDFLQKVKTALTKEEEILNFIFINEKVARIAAIKNEQEVDEKGEMLKKILFEAHNNVLFKNQDKFIRGTPPPISTALEGDITPMKWLVVESYKKFERKVDIFYHCCAEQTYNEILGFRKFFNVEKIKPAEIIKYIGDMMDKILSRRDPYLAVFDRCDIKEKEEARKYFIKEVKKGWNDQCFDIENNFVKYIDHHITNEFKDLNVDQFAAFPKKCALFFSYTEDITKFNKTYELMFVTRLIKKREKIKELEYPIIEKIRAENNSRFVSQFSELIKDVETSIEMADKFRKENATRNDAGAKKMSNIKFEPLVLKKNDISNIHIKEETHVPAFLDDLNTSFINFYTRGRQTHLLLLQDHSFVESKLSVPPNEKSKKAVVYTITADIVCTKIIHCIYTAKSINLSKINDTVSEAHEMVGKYIIKLISLKLIKRTHAKDKKKLNDDDVFEMNPGFWSKKKNVPIPTLASSRKENEKLRDKGIEEDKLERIKCTIVRTLKQKNIVPQKELEEIVFAYIGNYFRPDLNSIRNCLKSLEKTAEDDNYFHREGSGADEVLVYNK